MSRFGRWLGALKRPGIPDDCEPLSRPRLWVTLGTVSYGVVAVLQSVLDAVRNIDYEVLVAVGPEGDYHGQMSGMTLCAVSSSHLPR